ncbi:hypothetical protein ASG43_18855 [Aureimonas sp. Leaf454]|nr:hypothetical protein ASG43_18855 [Aureimonas sp. Leaf454]
MGAVLLADASGLVTTSPGGWQARGDGRSGADPALGREPRTDARTKISRLVDFFGILPLEERAIEPA